MRNSSHALLATLLLVACAPKHAATPETSIRISLAALATGATLPANYCYFVHVTGDGITTTPADACGPEVGLGQLSPSVPLDGSLRIEVKVGAERRFDLLGVPSPFPLDSTGVPRCGPMTVERLPNSSGTGFQTKVRLGTVEVQSRIVHFFKAKADVNPGENTLAFESVPYEPSALTKDINLGTPYSRSNRLPPPPGCGPALVITSKARVGPTGAYVAVPQTSTSASARLLHLTSGPIMTNNNATSTGGAKLHTGHAEIVYEP